MNKLNVVKDSMINELMRTYDKTNGKVTIYLKENLKPLIIDYAEYKADILMNDKNNKIISFPAYVLCRALVNSEVDCNE